jgi:GAF domain-containing protein
MSPPAEQSASSGAGTPAETGLSAQGTAAGHEALRRVAALVARGVRHAELFALASQELAQLVHADAAALLRFEPDETITVLAAWNTAGGPAPVGDREPVNAALRRLRDTARPLRCGPSDIPLTGPFSAALRRLGIRAAVAVPIQADGRVWGITVAAWQNPAPIPAATRSPMAEFTELIATAISNTEGRAQRPAGPGAGPPEWTHGPPERDTGE